MTTFIPSKVTRISDFFESREEADNWQKKQKFSDKYETIKTKSCDSFEEANNWIKEQQQPNSWKVIEYENKDSKKEFYFIIWNNSQNGVLPKYGPVYLFIGIIANIFLPLNYGIIAMISILYSLGVSCIFYNLSEQEFNFSFLEGINFLSDIIKGNGKFKGSVAIFFATLIVSLIVFAFALDKETKIKKIINNLADHVTIKSLESFSFDESGNIKLNLILNFKVANEEGIIEDHEKDTGSLDINNIKIVDYIIKNLELEPSEGLLFDKDGNIISNLNLQFKEINRNFNIKQTNEISEIFIDKELIVEDNLPEIKFNFKLIEHDLNVGFVHAKIFKRSLTKIADFSLKDDYPHYITSEIINECAELIGICKVPHVEKVKISFDENLEVNTAYVCPGGPIYSEFVITNADSIILTKASRGRSSIILIENLVPYDDESPCQDGIFNWIKVSKSHANALGFPNGTIKSRNGLGEVFKSHYYKSEQ